MQKRRAKICDCKQAETNSVQADLELPGSLGANHEMHQASSLSSLHDPASRAREDKADMGITLEEGVVEGDILILPF